MKSGTRLIYVLTLALSLLLALSPSTSAQTDSALAIRVESNQVVVPVFVYDKQLWDLSIYSPSGELCLTKSGKALQAEGISVRQAPAKCWGGPIQDLALKDFRVLEDGIEQKIQSVTREHSHWWELFDNDGDHSEYSDAPIGKWSTVDTHRSQDEYWAPPADDSYVIAYIPTPSAKGSCHQIKVSVNRRNVVVFNRSEYCNLQRPLTDPLVETALGQQMERDLASPNKPRIPLSAASGAFFSGSGTTRLHLVLEFSQRSLHYQWQNQILVASIGVLALVYRKDGTLATRFSDEGCCSRDLPTVRVSVFENAFDSTVDAHYDLPTRYEAEYELPPGEYELRVILSDGKKFGIVELPLTIENYANQSLALSSIALCKRYHRVDPPAYTDGILPSQFVPLASKGMEFTPSTETNFGKHDSMFAYFEAYQPQADGSAAANVHFQLKITDADSGQLKIDSGLRSADEFIQQGKQVIPIVQEIAVHDLPKGNYRLEVQASDSAGHRTPWHTATFAVRY